MRRLTLMVTILIVFTLFTQLIKHSDVGAQRTFPQTDKAKFEDGQPGNMLGILFLWTY